jgi:hypothetical protein
MDLAFGQRLVDASLICPQRTTALQKQGDAFERETMLGEAGYPAKMVIRTTDWQLDRVPRSLFNAPSSRHPLAMLHR